ncbi:hypothetical protein NLJ89_g6843 [Agrocybe chaxingu]|uniref:Uncharacterized protein n=1 Tax=Agrocybe chaxingu TaxID=84603 RepID=A0A9W8JYC9_9AGAR|nr:hypothetical protein NLJ89_g6843 [Agrocybe chaxingu]
MNTLEDCINWLSTTLERFQLANDLCDSDLLQKLQSRLKKIQHLTQHVANKMDNIDDKVEDICAILFKLKRSGALLHSDTLFGKRCC